MRLVWLDMHICDLLFSDKYMVEKIEFNKWNNYI